MLSTLESSASHPWLSDPGCPLPRLVIAHSGCLCAVGDTVAHLEQVGAPPSAQLAARAKSVVLVGMVKFSRARKGPNVSPEAVLFLCTSSVT